MSNNFEIIDGNRKFKYKRENVSAVGVVRYKDHYHMAYELFYLIQGDIDFQIEQERYSLNPDDVLLIRPGQHHNAIVRSSLPYERIVLRFNSSDLPETLERKLNTLPEVFNIRGLKSKTAYSLLLDISEHIAEDCLLTAMKSQTGIILCSLCSEAGLKREANYISKELEKAIRYIEENLADINSEEDLCKGLNKSSSALRKLFIRNLNTSVMSYVRTKKCMKADEMLSAGLSPKQVYRDCGFNYYSTFYRDYVKTYGKSPMSHRGVRG